MVPIFGPTAAKSDVSENESSQKSVLDDTLLHAPDSSAVAGASSAQYAAACNDQSELLGQ